MRRIGSRSCAGYTLIEVMIVAVIAAMLLAIAIPGYHGYVDGGRIARAASDLGEIHLALKRWETNSGAYPETLAAAGLGDRIDPWGNPYRYLRLDAANIGSARKDRNLVPINTDYDLYSVGRDSLTSATLTAPGARDDVIRANNGAYIGLAEDY